MSSKQVDGEASTNVKEVSLSNLFLHANDIEPLGLEPYVYVSDPSCEYIDSDCVLLVRCSEDFHHDEDFALAVRVLKCVCATKPGSHSSITCRKDPKTIPLGLSTILWYTLRMRGMTPSGCKGRLQRLAMRQKQPGITITQAKFIHIRVLESTPSPFLKDQLTSDWQSFRRIKNHVELLKSHLNAWQPYSLDQIYSFRVAGNEYFFVFQSFKSIRKAGDEPIFASSEARKIDKTLFYLLHSSFAMGLSIDEPEKDALTTLDCPCLQGLAKVGISRDLIDLLELNVLRPLTMPDFYFSVTRELLLVRPPKGVLLFGPPGTGKTFLTTAIAEEIQLRWKCIKTSVWQQPEIVSVNASHILQGETQTLLTIFLEAKKRFENSTQTLLIIDEIDALCPTREEASERAIELTTLLLTHLDGPEASVGTLIIGTTNRPEALDPAIRRPGRFDREIELDIPNEAQRTDIVWTCARRHGMRNVIVDEATARRLAVRAHGFTPSDIDLWFITTHQQAQKRFFKNTSTTQLPSSFDFVVTLEDFEAALVLVQPSGLKDFAIEIPKTSWNDIGGYEEVKNILKESVEWPLKYSDLFKKLCLTPPRGILLYGPPGNSKTILAKAVASEAQMNFISVKGPEIFSKWVGESEKTIRTIFRKARQHAPTVIFFDEIDAIGIDRQQSSGTGVESRVLSQMLNELDGISASRQVIIIGATNRPDLLDAALLRPGRFDRIVFVSLPDRAARNQIIQIHLKNAQVDTSMDVLSAKLAEMTNGYSGAEIAMICLEARMSKLRERLSQDTLLYDRNKDASTDLKRLSIELRLDDFERVVARSKPRTSPELMELYRNFNKRIK